MSHVEELDARFARAPLHYLPRIRGGYEAMRAAAQAQDDRETLGLIEAEWYANGEGEEA